MNGLDKIIKEEAEEKEKWKAIFSIDNATYAYRLVCGWICFIWINLFVAILPPIALLNFYKGNYWEAGGELAFALLAVYANKAVLK